MAKLVQNDRHFFVGGLDARIILHYADVPFLNFDQDLSTFCDYTTDATGTALQKPPLWQRPLDPERVTSLAAWLDTGSARCLPDAVLLGERAEFWNRPCVTLLPTAGRTGTAYNITVENRLASSCPLDGSYLNQQGQPVFQTRCARHECPHHQSSTNPLQIIDGQHRIHGLYRSSILQKEVAAVFLLLPREDNPTYPVVLGFTADAQAAIFRQVNTESTPLEDLHRIWLKRFFDDRWTQASPPPKLAYDILMHLGGTRLSATGNPNPWGGRVKGHPKRGARDYIDTLRGAENPAGKPGAVADVVSSLSASPPAPSHPEQLQHYIQGSIQALPHMWQGPGASLAPFQNRRMFEVVVRLLPRLKAWKEALGKTGFTPNDWAAAWQLQAPNFTAASADDWKRYAATGEQPSQEFDNMMGFMWPSPQTPYKAPPAAPSWETRAAPGVTGPCPDWKTYITLPPDPITWLRPRTRLNPGSHASSRSKTQAQPAIVAANTGLAWEGPRNVVREPEVHYRDNNGPWIEFPGSGETRTVSARGIVAPGTGFQVRIRYENIRGDVELIADLRV